MTGQQVCVCVCMCACLFVFLCVCVCVRVFVRYVGQFLLTACEDGAELSILGEGAEQLPPRLGSPV